MKKWKQKGRDRIKGDRSGGDASGVRVGRISGIKESETDAERPERTGDKAKSGDRGNR